MRLYKYRSLQNFKYFVDIVLENRIHAAPYFEMNDPMEGHFKHNIGDNFNDFIRLIKDKKSGLKICSLSRKNNDPLMWSHYSDCQRGVVIGVEIDKSKYEIRTMNYNGIFHLDCNKYNFDLESAKSILCNKMINWKYEEEMRIFVTGDSEFVSVKVVEVFLGSRVKDNDRGFLEKLISNINQNITVKYFENIDVMYA